MMNNKRFHNENGVTLIEVLAALMLASVVIGVLTMSFMSINHEWSSSTNKYNDDVQARMALHRISDDLTDSVEAYVIADEVRYAPGKGNYKTIKFENNSLILYDYLAPRLSEPGTYTNGRILASNVHSAPTVSYNGDSNYEGTINNGGLFELTIPFLYSSPKIQGNVTEFPKDYNISVKLFRGE